MSIKRLLSVTLVLGLLTSVSFSNDLILNNTQTKVLFSPNGGCTEAIINEIDNAQSEILVHAYSFTSVPIAKALLEAHKRGVNVQAILDRVQSSNKYSSGTFLANSKIPPYIDTQHRIQHNKVMVIDEKTLITGSFNFTKKAESDNAENLLILKCPDLAKLYRENWNRHREHLEKLEPRY
jgi:phosphatidylserine/phosphatidylglycerophosphate/cardiolipin synthase-like enzyme